MPKLPEWKKTTLVLVVCCVHLVLVAGFSHSFVSGKSAKSTGKNFERMLVRLSQIVNKPVADTFEKHQAQTDKINSKVADELNRPANQTVPLPPAPYWSELQSHDYFLDNDAVDKTAEPPDDFEVLLAQFLPLNIQSVVLEFWIAKDGRTVEVKCIEGACSDDVLASLQKLGNLTFTPAVKDGEAVANRKVIQIDSKPSFGL